MTATVSVIVRTKDRPVLLARALESIAAQTLADREVVVVNDGGDAAEVEAIVGEFGTSLGDVVLVHHEEPVGRPVAMNVGVRSSSSPLFVFHDDDDSWQPEFLERSVAHLQEHEDDVAVATRCFVVYERVSGAVITEIERETFASDLQRVLLGETLYRNSTPPICLTFRRSVYDEVGGYDDELVALADWEFLLRVLASGTVGFIGGEPLANWHHRRDDLSAAGNSIHADGSAHARFNQVIRDRYLRKSVQSPADLGRALSLADGFRRIDEKADAARAEQSRIATERADASRAHLDAVHADLLGQLQDMRGQIVSLTTVVEALRLRLDPPKDPRFDPNRLRPGRVIAGARRRLARLGVGRGSR